MNVDRTLSILIIIFLIIGLFGVLYIVFTPNEAEKYTEFYLLGQNGKAGSYPTNMTTGEEGNLTIGIINHEYSTTSYQLKIKMNNETLKETDIILKNNEKQEMPFEFTAGPPGQYKLEIDLYKLPDTANVYRSTFLLINVNS